MLNVRNEPGARFNVLLAEDQPHPVEHWTHQLRRLLEPQGVRSFTVRTSREAMDLVESVEIHAAVIDLDTPPGTISRRTAQPAGRLSGDALAGGLWLLDLLRRAQQRPPVVVVSDIRLAPAQTQRLLAEALRLGAFSVLQRPSELDELLAVMRRLLDRQYRGQWPSATQPPHPGGEPPRDPPHH